MTEAVLMFFVLLNSGNAVTGALKYTSMGACEAAKKEIHYELLPELLRTLDVNQQDVTYIATACSKVTKVTGI
jgi:hypothetical protein